MHGHSKRTLLLMSLILVILFQMAKPLLSLPLLSFTVSSTSTCLSNTLPHRLLSSTTLDVDYNGDCWKYCMIFSPSYPCLEAFRLCEKDCFCQYHLHSTYIVYDCTFACLKNGSKRSWIKY